MKKLMIVLALLASFQVANAQAGPAAAKKALDAALAASQNAKKATKVATWMKLAESYVEAYNAPSGNVWIGANENELKLAMGNEKPASVENVVLGGAQYVKQVYDNKNLYFNTNGQLEIIEVTKPVVENALDKAVEAYKKAAEVDTKATKAKLSRSTTLRLTTPILSVTSLRLSPFSPRLSTPLARRSALLSTPAPFTMPVSSPMAPAISRKLRVTLISASSTTISLRTERSSRNSLTASARLTRPTPERLSRRIISRRASQSSLRARAS